MLDVRGDGVLAYVQLRGDFLRAALPRIEQLGHLDFAAGKPALRKDVLQRTRPDFLRRGVFLALFRRRHFVAPREPAREDNDIADVHGEKSRVVGKIIVVFHECAEQKIFLRLPHQMKNLAENQKDVERAPGDQNRKIRTSAFRPERDDRDFKNQPGDQDANRKPVDEIEIRGKREHHREKNRAADERGIYLPSY